QPWQTSQKSVARWVVVFRVGDIPDGPGSLFAKVFDCIAVAGDVIDYKEFVEPV
ncbi:MAG: hypothetical protein Q9226_006542, partial [Calogaya cf. arnoldii]